MNTSLLDKFSCYKTHYQILYGLMLTCILTFLAIMLLFFGNKTLKSYKGVISQNNILVISDLTYLEIEEILTSKRLEIDNKKINYEIKSVKEGVESYTLKLKINKFYLDSRSINVNVILKEENLYQFIMKVMKGE